MKSVADHCSKSWAIIIRPKMKSYGAKHTHGFVCFKNLPINNVRALKSASWTVIIHALLFIYCGVTKMKENWFYPQSQFIIQKNTTLQVLLMASKVTSSVRFFISSGLMQPKEKS